jgi:DNA-binding sugar fermentation-stimulating protein
MVAPMMGSDGVCLRRESEVRRTVWVGALDRNLTSVAVNNFLHNKIFKEILQNLKFECNLRCFCNKMNYSTQNGSFPFIFTDHTMLVVK